jgi:hypothetical protein
VPFLLRKQQAENLAPKYITPCIPICYVVDFLAFFIENMVSNFVLVKNELFRNLAKKIHNTVKIKKIEIFTQDTILPKMRAPTPLRPKSFYL